METAIDYSELSHEYMKFDLGFSSGVVHHRVPGLRQWTCFLKRIQYDAPCQTAC